ncbi:ribonuclease III [Aeoliella mucimassa]|uniref:Ribonuclease 3 n=1 Tax=Aeoliella mucimassa TaxID=2527972 RepID=A0A518AJP8_9BACT|nr:ribonuclease III [Aeoliella mucimassa]QDU54951.1 Ribonuclease 3 [Aeoliella mucimassa]
MSELNASHEVQVDFEACQARIGYYFKNLSLLESALTHASGAENRLASNERMEFLGDAILGSVVCQRLFLDFPEHLEGELTRLKSIVVSRKTCAKVSTAMALDQFLILGKGMTTHPEVPSSVLAAVFEALVAAIFLDGGGEAAKEFIERCMVPEIELAESGEMGRNYKSQLQQLAQREHGVTPNYRLVDEKGPDHSKCFQVAAEIGDQRFSPAWGKSKKESEQRAAANAIYGLRGEDAPYGDEFLEDEYQDGEPVPNDMTAGADDTP